MKRRTKVRLEKIKRFSFDMFKRFFGIAIGSILIAIAYNGLIIPYGLLSGGIGGISLIGEYVFNIPVYLGFLILNIPIFLWGLKELNIRFMFFSLVGTLTFIISLPLFEQYVPIPELDMILVAIFSGIINGLGVGIVLKFGASGGGVDIISVIMKKRANIPVGTFSFGFNLAVLIASLFFFNLNITLYTVINMWVTAKLVNFVLQGINRKKSLTIISDKNDLIAKEIIKNIKRGITFIKGEGAYKKKEKLIINTVVNNLEYTKIKRIVESIDKKAFMYITEASDVSGKGFTLSQSGKALENNY